jgi:hypothetical protein
MKKKMALAASFLLVSEQTASAQYYSWNPYWYSYGSIYNQYMDTPQGENDLVYAKARRDKARQEREETGKSDWGARLRLQAECSRAIERGVEEGVRRSYGCGQSFYVPPVQQQPAGSKVVYSPSVQRQPTGPKVIYPPSSAIGQTDQ